MPRPSKEDAKRRLNHGLEEIPSLRRLNVDSPSFVEWHRDTWNAIAQTFGDASHHVREFNAIAFTPTTSKWHYPNEIQRKEAFSNGLNYVSGILRSMITEIQEYWEEHLHEPFSPNAAETPQTVNSNRVFVIHGRDHGTKDSVARFLEGLGLEAVILEEQPDRGLTVIEKFEQNASGDFVVALLTPDDVGGPNPDKLQPRARQNVIFELGYFVRAFGRNRVRALMKGDVEIPSDYAGVLYVPMDESGGWQMRLIREMNSAGFKIDANLAL